MTDAAVVSGAVAPAEHASAAAEPVRPRAIFVVADGRAAEWREGADAVPAASPRPAADAVAAREAAHPIWAWDTAAEYPALLAQGHRVERAHDLRLARRLLRPSSPAFTALPRDAWDGEPPDADQALFAFGASAGEPLVAAGEELARQRAALAARPDLRLLTALESAAALAAAELRHAGLPWRSDVHTRILEERLGPRTPAGVRPEQLEHLRGQIVAALGGIEVNPDSPVELTKALRGAGLPVTSSRASELRSLDHPVIAPLLEYKRRARLLTANGWHWLDTWVRDGRFHAEYLVGGVPTGRWAARGGGVLQLPKELRPAVIADPGWTLVMADVAQLEPRVLAAMARDTALAEAGRGHDLYDGIVAAGAAPDRRAAKYGMLGALYGATQGLGGALMPRLARRFPAAIGIVERAARAGEAGESVRTLLGRVAPPPDERWLAAAAARGSGDAAVRRADALARERGRFTRNFVVQGTAAEWADCWLAGVRNRLWALGSGPLTERPHLVYFLHDEIIVHTPIGLADQVAEAIHAAAARAGRTLFGDFPVDFPLQLRIGHSYAAESPPASASGSRP